MVVAYLRACDILLAGMVISPPSHLSVAKCSDVPK